MKLFNNPRVRPVFGKAPRPDTAKPFPKSDAAAGMEDRNSPSDPFFAPAAASGADDHSIHAYPVAAHNPKNPLDIEVKNACIEK